MQLILNVMFAMTAAILVVACALIPPTVGQPLRQSAAMSFTIYANAWQPALIKYSKLDYCGTPAVPPCRDRMLYAKLYAADAAVASCVVASVKALNENASDLSGVASCLEKVENAKIAFAQGGLQP